MHRRRALRLDRDDAPVGRRRGDPGDEPAAAGRHEDRLDLRRVLEQLERRACPGRRSRAGRRRGARASGPSRGCARRAARTPRPASAASRSTAAPYPRVGRHLRGARARVHDDEAVDPFRGRAPGERLRVVAGRDPDHAARLLLRAQRGELVEDAARLERAGPLEELGLQPDARACARDSVREEKVGVRWTRPRIRSGAQRATSRRGVTGDRRRDRRLRPRETTDPVRITVDGRPPALAADASSSGCCSRSRTSSGSRSGRSPRSSPPSLNWFAVLVTTPAPRPFHRFLTAYVRYATHVGAFLVARGEPVPGLRRRRAGYPVDVEIDPSRSRSGALVTARSSSCSSLPALLIAAVLGGEALTATAAAVRRSAAVAAFLGWFAALVLGRMPRGLRDLGACVARLRRAGLGLPLLAHRPLPDSDPNAHVADAALPEHPVRLAARRRRSPLAAHRLLPAPARDPASRLAVALGLRGLRSPPFVGWFVALVDRPARREPLHRFMRGLRPLLGARLRVPAPRREPVPRLRRRSAATRSTIAIDPPARQHRLVTLFRLVLALPGARDRGAARLPALRGRVPGLVRVARHRADADGPAQRRAPPRSATRRRRTPTCSLLTAQYPHSTPTLARAGRAGARAASLSRAAAAARRARGGGLTNRARRCARSPSSCSPAPGRLRRTPSGRRRVPGGLDLPQVDLARGSTRTDRALEALRALLPDRVRRSRSSC